MTINGKRDDFTLEDLLAVGAQVRGMDVRQIVREVGRAVARWPEIAREVGVAETTIDAIARSHRLYLVS